MSIFDNDTGFQARSPSHSATTLFVEICASSTPFALGAPKAERKPSSDVETNIHAVRRLPSIGLNFRMDAMSQKCRDILTP